MADEENPLEELHIDANEFDREALADFLKQYVAIDEDTGEPRFLGEYDDLGGEKQIVTVLLYRKAARDLGHYEEEGLSSRALSEHVSVGKSTVSRHTKELEFVDNDGDRGGYFIIEPGLHTAIDFVEAEEKGE
jgi:hypothetical protein